MYFIKILYVGYAVNGMPWIESSEWDLFPGVFTYKEFVLVTEGLQCDRMTRQDTDNKNNNIQIDNVQNSKNTIYKISNLVCRPTGVLSANLKCK